MSKPLSPPNLPHLPTPTATPAGRLMLKSRAPANAPGRAAQTDAIAALRPRIMKLAGRLTGNKFDADDLTQNALVRAIEQQDKYRDGNLGGWAAVIAYREFYTEKGRNREVPMAPDIINLHGHTEPNQYDTIRLRELLTFMDKHLTSAESRALILKGRDTQVAAKLRTQGREKLKAFDE